MNLSLGPVASITFVYLCVCICVNAAVGLGFIIRKDDNKRADYFFALLLFAFAMTCLHHVFTMKRVYIENHGLLFLPIYYTLTFGGALFFSVKLRLFSAYKFNRNDSKHLILPLGQFIYFMVLFLFTSASLRHEIGRKFYSPFYGGLEMALYIATFHTYLIGAFRYIQYKILTDRKEDDSHASQESRLLGKMVKIMSILFWINSAYIIGDFVMYELLRLNMHDFRGFTRFGEFTFATMAFWTGWIGWKLLTRQPYESLTTALFLLLKNSLLKGKALQAKLRSK